jgi:hypothetical protein
VSELIQEDEQLFLRRYALPTSIDDLHDSEVSAVVPGPSTIAPSQLAYPQLVGSSTISPMQDASIEVALDHAQPKDVTMPSAEEMGWRAKRTKSTKKKKKDKEKDKDNGYDRSTWQSMDFARWIATIKANPTHTVLSRVPPKAITTPPTPKPPPPPSAAQITQRPLFRSITTADWNVAIREKKLLHVHTRILELQRAALWSFKQPKRQKEPAMMLGKSHWDWLKDEALWMSRDFREEKKWKAMVGWRIGQELKQVFEAERPVKRRKLNPDIAPVGDSMQVDPSAAASVEPQAVPSKPIISGAPTEDLLQDLGGDTETEVVEVLDADGGAEAELDAFEALKASEEAEIKEEEAEEVPMEIDTPNVTPHKAQTTQQPLTKEEEEAEMQDAQEVEDFTITIPDLPLEQPAPSTPSPNKLNTEGEPETPLLDGLKSNSANPILATPSETPGDPRPRINRQNSTNIPEIESSERLRSRKTVLSAGDDDFILNVDITPKTIETAPKNLVKQDTGQQEADKGEGTSEGLAMAVDSTLEAQPPKEEEESGLEDLFPSLTISAAGDNIGKNDILRAIFPELVVYSVETTSAKHSNSPASTSRNSPSASGEARVVPLLHSKRDRPQLAQSVPKAYIGPGTSRFLTAKPIIYSALPGAQWEPSPDLKRAKQGLHPIMDNDPRFAGKTGRWNNLDEWVCVVDDAQMPAWREKEKDKVDKILLDAELGISEARKSWAID